MSTDGEAPDLAICDKQVHDALLSTRAVAAARAANFSVIG